MQEYVLIYAENEKGEVLLVTKNKPAWQKGKLNLVGGKIEVGEDSSQAAKREFEEETGICCKWFPLYKGGLVFADCKIDCFSYGIVIGELNPRPEETETVSFYNIQAVMYKDNLMPNLRLIIPLIKYNVPFLITAEEYVYPTLSTSLQIYG